MPTVARFEIAFFSATSITKPSLFIFANDHLGFNSLSLKTKIDPSRSLEIQSSIHEEN